MCSKTKLNSVKDESTGKEHKPSDRTKAGGEDTHAQERRDISNRAQPAQDCSTKRQQQTQQDENATKLQLVKQFACRAAAVGASATATRDRLQGGRFRHLNEFLYTNKGEAAFAEYQREPELFDIVRPLKYYFRFVLLGEGCKQRTQGSVKPQEQELRFSVVCASVCATAAAAALAELNPIAASACARFSTTRGTAHKFAVGL